MKAVAVEASVEEGGSTNTGCMARVHCTLETCTVTKLYQL